MSWAFGTAGTLTSGAPTLNVPYPASISAGDILICACGYDSSGTSFTLGDVGFNSILASTNDASVQLFWKVATGSESGTFTCASPGAFIYAQCARFTGGPASASAGNVDNSGPSFNTGAAQCFWPSMTISTANCLVVAVTAGFFGGGVSGNIDIPSPWTNAIGRTFGGSDIFGWEYVIQTTATNITSGNWTASISGTGNYETVIASLKPGSGGGATTHFLSLMGVGT